ncbi:MAG: toprim domain-containing protein [Anaerolineales bacterium]|nr:toprim domain-containing protein [Anaerolineales bacterium]
MMTDIQALKTRCDVRLLVEADLGPAHSRGGKALLWRCPFHNEHKGFSLAVWDNGWRCFGACSVSGDALDWLQKYRGMSFEEACTYLGAEDRRKQPICHVPRERSAASEAPPAEDWQREAWGVVDSAEEVLWSEQGGRALIYLKTRGLTDETILRARLGYIPGPPWEWLRIGKLTVPCGIVIPWAVGKELWAVKVRRAAGLPKYTQIAGGSAHGLYNAANLEGHETVLFVEGEFDALLAEQECGGLVGVATLGSASGMLNPRWMPLLLHCKTILVAYDADQAGMKGAARLQALTKRARVVQVPWGKDITEFVLKDGSVREWLSELT